MQDNQCTRNFTNSFHKYNAMNNWYNRIIIATTIIKEGSILYLQLNNSYILGLYMPSNLFSCYQTKPMSS